VVPAAGRRRGSSAQESRTGRVYQCLLRGGVPNSTARVRKSSYSPGMSQEPIQAVVVDQGFEDRWAAWQARGAANDRATRRKLWVVAAILILPIVALSVLSLLR
jgi:hypothetical protein